MTKILQITFQAVLYKNVAFLHSGCLRKDEELKPKKIISQGEIPSPINVPPGCSFHLRCPEKMEIYSQVDPTMVQIQEGHLVRCHLFQEV